MSTFSRIAPRLEQAFSKEFLSIEVKKDHLVVENSRDQSLEKVKAIIHSLNLCPIVFRCQACNHIKFTLTPYSIPEWVMNRSIHKEAMQWGQEVISNGARPVSEFQSSIDPLLQRDLGQHFFNYNVAKMFINGYPFTLIADRHLQKNFRVLLPHLIEEVNNREDKTIALFVEACQRDSVIETAFFSDHLRGRQVKGLLYGMESSESMMVTEWITYNYRLARKESPKNICLDFWYNLIKKPNYQVVWEKLKKSSSYSACEKISATFESLLFAQNNFPESSVPILEESAIYHDAEALMELFKQLTHLVLETIDLSEDLKFKIKEFLHDPTNGLLIAECHQEINHAMRDPAIVKNIGEVVQKLPKSTEIVIFVGYLHMQKIMEGLQKTSKA